MKFNKNPYGNDLEESIELTTRLQENLKRMFTQNKSKQAFQFQTPTMTENKNIKSTHVRTQSEAFNINLIHEQNQLLKSEVKQLQNQLTSSKEEIKSLRKYANFLQNFNNQLKKEVVLWMNKSSRYTSATSHLKIQKQPFSLLEERLSKYKKGFNHQLADHMSMSYDEDFKQKQQNLRPMGSFSMSKTNKKLMQNEEESEKQCTSCNYIKIKDCLPCDNRLDKTSKKHKKTQSQGKKKKPKYLMQNKKLANLCGCHRSYVEKSYFG